MLALPPPSSLHCCACRPMCQTASLHVGGRHGRGPRGSRHLAHTYPQLAGGGEANPLWLDIDHFTAAAGGGAAAIVFMLDTGQHSTDYSPSNWPSLPPPAFTMNSMTVIRSVYLAFLLLIFTITIVFPDGNPFLAPAGRYGLIAAAEPIWRCC